MHENQPQPSHRATAKVESCAYRFKKLWQSVGSRVRQIGYRALGMKLAGPVWMERIEWPDRPGCVSLGEGAMLDRDVTLLATCDEARIVIGARVYINRRTMFDAHELVEIGEETMVGPGCYITDHDHTFSKDTAPGAAPLVAKPTVIGKRCWLGANVTVLKGVTIGDGTVVGAGSVVTKSLPAGVLAVGVPAKVIREL
jgi:acetyltransferase-like isoleucine patch superfamily enzyme